MISPTRLPLTVTVTLPEGLSGEGTGRIAAQIQRYARSLTTALEVPVRPTVEVHSSPTGPGDEESFIGVDVFTGFEYCARLAFGDFI